MDRPQRRLTLSEPGAVLLRDGDFPADPYPGARPDCSYVHVGDRGSFPLRPAGLGRWELDATPLPQWLADRGLPGLRDRVPVLAYGSNACPSKIGWLRAARGLRGPVIVLRCRTVGLSAVWCAHPRLVDDQLPAVLVAAPGRAEQHAVWLATEEQRIVLDAGEGRGDRYDLVRLAGAVEVHTEDGAAVRGTLAYVTAAAVRAPLQCDGRPVPITEVDQAGARLLAAGGAPAADWGLHGLTVEHLPTP